MVKSGPGHGTDYTGTLYLGKHYLSRTLHRCDEKLPGPRASVVSASTAEAEYCMSGMNGCRPSNRTMGIGPELSDVESRWFDQDDWRRNKLESSIYLYES